MKTAVITGAGGVLCSTFARHLAADGYAVALLDINYDAAAAVAKDIASSGGRAKAYKCDVLSRESIASVHSEILADFGRCDLLINGAGGNNPKCTTDKEYYSSGDRENADVKSFFDLDESGFRFVFDLNILGVLLPTQEFIKDMLSRPEDGCNIINISSMNAYRPLTKIPAYSAAKAGVSNLTQWLAVHFAGENIRINAIAPGFFVTNQNRALLFDDDGNPTARTEKILSATPMKRFGEPEELLGALDFLADSEKSGFITGVILPVDGGFNAYSGV